MVIVMVPAAMPMMMRVVPVIPMPVILRVVVIVPVPVPVLM